ncbi:MAG TPA: response regulator transcription factor [Polyangiales bacterium]|jgi:DNA-binding response OmpR family regulator|nr:response regulator transcription factor [Polyangiales bacterium]
MALLLVEDNRVMRTSLARGLSEDGFPIEAVENGAAALERLACGDVEAVILDLGLPDMDGTSILDFIRARELMAPVLVLTARDAIDARVDALDRGADDFLVKPFHYTELLARVRAMMRRSAAPRWAPLSCNGLVFENEGNSIKLGTERITLSPYEHELLGLLLRRQGQTVSRTEVVALLNYGTGPSMSNTVSVHIGNLRRKLGSSHVVIEPVRSLGYRLRPASDGSPCA